MFRFYVALFIVWVAQTCRDLNKVLCNKPLALIKYVSRRNARCKCMVTYVTRFIERMTETAVPRFPAFTSAADRLGACVWVVNLDRAEYFFAGASDYDGILSRTDHALKRDYSTYRDAKLSFELLSQNEGVDVSLLVGAPRGDEYPAGCNVFCVYRLKLTCVRKNAYNPDGG